MYRLAGLLANRGRPDGGDAGFGGFALRAPGAIEWLPAVHH